MLISQELAKAFNQQIGHEFGASLQYLSIAAHFYQRSLTLLAKLFQDQAEEEKQQRLKDFHGFQINRELMSKAPEQAVVLHCLPAYRELEITDEVVESPQSLVFPQAENRLHFQKALIAVLMGKA